MSHNRLLLSMGVWAIPVGDPSQSQAGSVQYLAQVWGKEESIHCLVLCGGSLDLLHKRQTFFLVASIDTLGARRRM